MDAILRIAGSPEHLYIITVQPWTLTAALYPGARWTAISTTHVASMAPVNPLHKGLAGGLLATSPRSRSGRSSTKRCRPRPPPSSPGPAESPR